jgi:penicillin-binding protein 1B
MVGALFTNVFGSRPYLEGASTITQQLARNFFLTEEMQIEQQTGQRSLRRKLSEQFMALILTIKATKEEVLELYLNDVYLGNRGSFAIHGVAEAARLYFGKDVSNLSLGEAATIAGIIHSPNTLSPFNAPARARDRRNLVLRAMASGGFVSVDAAERASMEPLSPVARALDAEAPYFVDFVGQTLAEEFPAVTQTTAAVDVYTTLDLHLQRLAQDAVSAGVAKVDQLLSRRRKGRVPQAALIAVDPRTGDILAMVGGRSYNQSQFNRAVSANRDRCSSRSCSSRRSSGPPKKVWSSRPRRWSLTNRPRSTPTAPPGTRPTTRTSTTGTSPCGGRWPCRATLRR